VVSRSYFAKMGLLITTLLISFALIVIMITRQSEALAEGRAHYGSPKLFSAIAPHMRRWWSRFMEKGVELRKVGSHRAAVFIAKKSHSLSSTISHIVVRLHRHGRDK